MSSLSSVLANSVGDMSGNEKVMLGMRQYGSVELLLKSLGLGIMYERSQLGLSGNENGNEAAAPYNIVRQECHSSQGLVRDWPKGRG
jgi:hypothetical protein